MIFLGSLSLSYTHDAPNHAQVLLLYFSALFFGVLIAWKRT